MPDVETIRGVARARLGAIGRIARGECKLLARLLADDEPILAMVMAKIDGEGRVGSGRLVVATPLRLVLVGKGMVTRRDRIREIPLASIRAARAKPPGSLELDLDEGILRLAYVSPVRELAVLADAARGGRDPDRFAQLDALARRKLGGFFAFSFEGSLLALAEELERDEDVLDLAFWAAAPGGLLAACPTRIVAIPDKGLGSAPAISIPLDAIAEIHADGDDLLVRTADAEHRFADLAPADRASVIAARMRAHVAARRERAG